MLLDISLLDRVCHIPEDDAEMSLCSPPLSLPRPHKHKLEQGHARRHLSSTTSRNSTSIRQEARNNGEEEEEELKDIFTRLDKVRLRESTKLQTSSGSVKSVSGAGSIVMRFDGLEKAL